MINRFIRPKTTASRPLALRVFTVARQLVLGLSLIVFLIIPVSASAAPGIPHQFYGKAVFSDGSSVPQGMVVKAKIGASEVGSSVVANGKYGYNPSLLLAEDPDNNNSGKTVGFYLADLEASTTPSSITFANGEYTNLDLVFPSSEVSASGDISSLLDQGVIAVTGGTNSAASSVSIAKKVVINVSLSGGSSSVSLPQGVVITKIGGGTFNAGALAASGVSKDSISGLGSGVVADGVLSWGLANVGLEFSAPITVGIFVGSGLNGQTLNVVRSTTSSAGWTSDGIVAPASCTVVSGVCSFSATKASYYAAVRTVVASPAPPPSPAPSTSSCCGGSGGFIPIIRQEVVPLAVKEPPVLTSPEVIAPKPQVLGVKIYKDGTLLRGPDKTIYVIKAGKKHRLNLEMLKLYKGKKINNVAQDVILQYPEVKGIKIYPDGTLLRAPDKKKVYVVLKGRKKLLTAKQLKSYKKKNIYDVSKKVLLQIK